MHGEVAEMNDFLTSALEAHEQWQAKLQAKAQEQVEMEMNAQAEAQMRAQMEVEIEIEIEMKAQAEMEAQAQEAQANSDLDTTFTTVNTVRIPHNETMGSPSMRGETFITDEFSTVKNKYDRQ